MSQHYIGLQTPSKALQVARLFESHRRLVLVCANQRSAEELVLDLQFFVESQQVLYLTDWQSIPLEAVSPQLDVSAERVAALMALAERDSFILVTYAAVLLQKIVPRVNLESIKFDLVPTQQIERQELLNRLVCCGYQSVNLVEEKGEMALRGSVVDLFPAAMQSAVRLEFNLNTLEKIKLFNPDSQRSSTELHSLTVRPVTERMIFPMHPLLSDKLPSLLERLKARCQELQLPLQEQTRLLEVVRSGINFPGLELMQVSCYEELDTFFDYLPSKYELVLDSPISIEQEIDLVDQHINERVQALIKDISFFPQPEKFYVNAEDLLKRLRQRADFTFDNLENPIEADHSIKIKTVSNLELSTRLKTQIGSGKALKPLAQAFEKWRKQDYRAVFIVGSHSRAQRLQKMLLEINLDLRIVDYSISAWLKADNPYPCIAIEGALSSGFQLPDEKLIFIAEHEIFSERSQRKKTPKTVNLRRLMNSLSQLKEGDYVVHIDYGVGIYRGLKHLKVNQAYTDLLHIDYADSRLFLPVQNISRIQKFVAAEGKAPQIDKLSSKRWRETKQKVSQSVAILAGELIRLYATRKVARGWRFDPSSAQDENFADSFAYNETPDQLKAIQETLQDMASERPMDRMICGDVGFGKTEVAIRAAFKCLQHARQVALLAPTTLLVEQHLQVFNSRFSSYPFKIKAISRFYTAAQNKETLQELASGQCDIIIGTHRLLQRDVDFKDLGLVIIDEEHRFGVKQKERLKQMKKQVDVLTLTATPIPRTLHMSLLGIRDISIISTAPIDRRTIRSYVATHEERLIRDAILRELQRGGQVFYLNNRVENIDLVTAELKALIPEARFEFAHGQMTETRLEKIMRRFLQREIDVLVCTTIIESGLDIPNANTIIIDRADTFGLAQLYQLRGRVGRSDRQAYAYFLVPKARKLSSEAQQRLKALQSLDDLGQGFNLAVRDLEIRGAGNLLGREQSGNVLLVGLELYNRILKEAIMNLRGEDLELEELIDPEVKINFDAFIPQEYVPDVSERLVLYQRLATIQSNFEAEELCAEISDRFGPAPDQVSNLIELMRVRVLLRQNAVEKAEISNDKIQLAFNARATVNGSKIAQLMLEQRGRFKFSKSYLLSITLQQPLDDAAQIYPKLQEILESIR